METKHTKGPWFLEQHGNEKKNENHITISLSDGSGWRDEEYMSVSGIGSEANAKLIAAAPDLLEASMYALECLPNYGVDSIRKILTDAIKKATQ